MNNLNVIGLSALALAAIFALFVMNIVPNFTTPVPTETLVPSDIKSFAVYRDGVAYPLNFEQQKVALNAITRAKEVTKADYPSAKGPFDFQKVVIYRFKGPSIDLIPIQYVESNLVFSLPAITKEHYFIELSGGEFKSMLDSAVDK